MANGVMTHEEPLGYCFVAVACGDQDDDAKLRGGQSYRD